MPRPDHQDFNPRRYVLVGHKAVEEPDYLRWARWFETADRSVKLSVQGEVTVSTVFLGRDHRFVGDGPPLLFETMAFGAERFEHQCECYSTWDEAVQGHDRWVKQVFAGTKADP
jgi:hypothetical protein